MGLYTLQVYIQFNYILLPTLKTYNSTKYLQISTKLKSKSFLVSHFYFTVIIVLQTVGIT